MELTSKKHTIKMFEDLVAGLVAKGMAEHVKEPFIADDGGIIDRQSTKFYTSVYDVEKLYQIIVAPSPFTEGGPVNVRFWYSENSGYGAIKITNEGFMMLMSSLTIIAMLQKLASQLNTDKSTNNNDKNIINMDLIKQIIIRALASRGKTIKPEEIQLKNEVTDAIKQV